MSSEIIGRWSMSKRSSRSPTAKEHLILRRVASHRLFRAMLRHQGIDPARACRDCEEKIFGALRACAGCLAPESCRSWLAEEHPRGIYPAFCPNGAVIESCRTNLDVGALSPRHAEPYCSASVEPALHGVLADLMIQQFVASERVGPLSRALRKVGGILAELDELAGELL